MTSDDESIPYKKDVTEETPEPTEGVQAVEPSNPNYNYGRPYVDLQPGQPRQWGGETEIN